jgi:hypothetical protein
MEDLKGRKQRCPGGRAGHRLALLQVYAPCAGHSAHRLPRTPRTLGVLGTATMRAPDRVRPCIGAEV